MEFNIINPIYLFSVIWNFTVAMRLIFCGSVFASYCLPLTVNIYSWKMPALDLFSSYEINSHKSIIFFS